MCCKCEKILKLFKSQISNCLVCNLHGVIVLFLIKTTLKRWFVKKCFIALK